MKLLGLLLFSFSLLTIGQYSFAQEAGVSARLDDNQITVGDRAKLFLEATVKPGSGSLLWAVIPDTFHALEIAERGKIDTLKEKDLIRYRQRLLITGFDSGVFTIPAFAFEVLPNSGDPYVMYTDSFHLLVQTVAVDTSQPYKGIKEIMPVKTSWRDYIWLIIGLLVLTGLVLFIVLYFRKHKKPAFPEPLPVQPVETPDQRASRLLLELEADKLWQSGRVKEYYIQLSDILRNYIEERFHIPAMERTTDELLRSCSVHPELKAFQATLGTILYTADLAKFAKAQLSAQEHTDTMAQSKKFVSESKPPVSPPNQPA